LSIPARSASPAAGHRTCSQASASVPTMSHQQRRLTIPLPANGTRHQRKLFADKRIAHPGLVSCCPGLRTIVRTQRQHDGQNDSERSRVLSMVG
jgi:hypothetical protein